LKWATLPDRGSLDTASGDAGDRVDPAGGRRRTNRDDRRRERAGLGEGRDMDAHDTGGARPRT